MFDLRSGAGFSGLGIFAAIICGVLALIFLALLGVRPVWFVVVGGGVLAVLVGLAVYGYRNATRANPPSDLPPPAPERRVGWLRRFGSRRV